MVVEDEELAPPLGLVDDEDEPPGLVLLDAPPLGLEDIDPDPEAEPDIEPPPVELLEPLMPLVLPVLPGAVVLELELDPGLLGAVDDEDDEPPGTTTVSLVLDGPLLAGGVVTFVSFFSHAESARPATTIIR